MKINTEALNNQEEIVSDVVIVGAGPSGITMADEWRQYGYRVNVLESGSDQPSQAVQQLSSGALSGHLYEPMESTHIRQVGGTANHLILKLTDKQYGYRYTPMEAIDFEERDYIPHSGWPITKSDLDPYYALVHHKCEIGDYDYTAARWNKQNDALLPMPNNKAETSVFMFGPTRKFNHDFPLNVSQSEKVDLYTNATAVELICDDSGQAISAVLVKTFDGKEILFKATYFILAANALQTPRLLLNSRRHPQHPNGIGNQHDNVGRYYMDHCLVPFGNFVPNDLKYINQMRFYDMQGVDGASVLGRVLLAEQFKRQHKLLNTAVILFPMSWNQKDLDAMYSLDILKTHFRWHWKEYPKDLGKHLWNVFQGRNRLFRAIIEKIRFGVPILVGLGNGGWSRSNQNEKKYHRLELLALVEQSPRPENRVTLIDEKDALGYPKIQAHYTWADSDIENYKKTITHMGETIEATGLGRCDPPESPVESVKESYGLHHMMGTTRMSKNPEDGVVDQNCKVHGVDNLFIASSAVFTTGSFVNPTLTNLALGLRVVDHVKGLLENQR